MDINGSGEPLWMEHSRNAIKRDYAERLVGEYGDFMLSGVYPSAGDMEETASFRRLVKKHGEFVVPMKFDYSDLVMSDRYGPEFIEREAAYTDSLMKRRGLTEEGSEIFRRRVKNGISSRERERIRAYEREKGVGRALTMIEIEGSTAAINHALSVHLKGCYSDSGNVYNPKGVPFEGYLLYVEHKGTGRPGFLVVSEIDVEENNEANLVRLSEADILIYKFALSPIPEPHLKRIK